MKRLVAALAISSVGGLSQTPPSLEVSTAPPKFVKLSPLDRKAMRAIRAEAAEPQAVGTHRLLEARSLGKGRWTKAGNGVPIWRLGIESPGASGLRVHFVGFDVRAGKVWLHAQARGQGKPEVVGPYSRKGPHQDGDFWSDVVFSPRVVIEYQPAGAGKEIPFRVPEISHLIQR